MGSGRVTRGSGADKNRRSGVSLASVYLLRPESGGTVRTDTPRSTTSHTHQPTATDDAPAQVVPDGPELRPDVARAVAPSQPSNLLPKEREASVRVPIEWREPGESVMGPVGWMRDAIKTLRSNPGRWALVAKFDKQTQAGSTVARLKKLGADAVSRKENGTTCVYARYVNGAAPTEE